MFEKHRIIVCGDAMMDTYWQGKATRISPEAPVPVLEYQERRNHLGGAANVACNLARLGAVVWLAAVVGADTEGQQLKSLLQTEGIEDGLMLIDDSRRTTHKIRIMASQQQLVRLDKEDIAPLGSTLRHQMLTNIEDCVRREQIEAIVLQDYNKGTLDASLIQSIIGLANTAQIPVFVDPKKTNFWAFKNCFLFKPNLREIRDQLSFEPDISPESLEKAAVHVRQTLNCQNVVITLSEHGIFYSDDHTNDISAAESRAVSDVSGAGDTVISTLVMAILSKFPLAKAVDLANKAAAIVCAYPGVVPIQLETLMLAKAAENSEP